MKSDNQQGAEILNICKKELKMTEKKIKEYFLRLNKIEFYQDCIKNTENNLKRIEQNMEKSNIVFCTSYSSIDYSKNRVQGSNSIYNGIEKEIDSAFHKLEEQKRKLKERLIDLQTNVDSLELKNEEIGCILRQLNEESQKIIDLKYRRNKNLDNIALKLNSSTASIGRKKDRILQDITKWLYVVN